MLNLIFLGAPGAGKGTIASELAKRKNIIHISTGDLFREAISKKTPLGKKALNYLDKGTLVPDEVTNELVEERLSHDDVREHGFILDGYPRNIPQGLALQDILQKLNLPLSKVFLFDVNESIIIDRITNRLSCPKCKRVYNTKHKETMPKVANTCDEDKTALMQRKDDSLEVVQKRLEVYNQETLPLKFFYKEKRILKKLNGSKPIEKSIRKIEKILRWK